jgi:hypothetical protein
VTGSHVQLLILASVAAAGGVIGWLCVLPDGTRDTFRREDHVFVSLMTCLVGGLGLYAAVVLPVILHALRSRWPFRVFTAVSVLFGLVNLGPILNGWANAQGPGHGHDQLLDYVWGLLLSFGLLLLYLLAGVCFISWAVWRFTSAESNGTQDLRAAR